MVNSLRRKTKIKKQPSLYTEHGPVDSLNDAIVPCFTFGGLLQF